MVLGTLDRTPPPFFRQGPSALARFVFFAALSLFLMVADTRFNITKPLRGFLVTVLHPVERALHIPVEVWERAKGYAAGMQNALNLEALARLELAVQSERAARVELLLQENQRLRNLLQLRPTLAVKSLAAEVLYDAPDPYSRKVIIDVGALSGVVIASPVVNELGVLGQVTRVYPYSAEVTLLTDKEVAIPVLNSRTQARSAAFGNSTGAGLELRYMASDADVQVGDVLSTSGVDGVYPGGLPVAKVVHVERRVESGFARIALEPVAQPDSARHVLVLEPVGLQMLPKPEPPTQTKGAMTVQKANPK